MIVEPKDKSFSTYYSRCRKMEEFKTANLPIKRPEIGAIVLDGDKILGISCAFYLDRVGERTWYNPMWAYTRGNAKLALTTSKKAFSQLPKNCTLLGTIKTRNKDNVNIYKSSLHLAKKLGFKVVKSNDECDVVKLDVKG
jgi:hypothetical protein